MPDASTSTSTTVTYEQGIQTTIYWDPVHKRFGTVRVGLEDSQYKFCLYINPMQRHGGVLCMDFAYRADR